MKLLDGYLASTQVLSPDEFKQDIVIEVTFKEMARSIAERIIERRKELPNEECLFVTTCKIYKWREYKEAHEGR